MKNPSARILIISLIAILAISVTVIAVVLAKSKDSEPVAKVDRPVETDSTIKTVMKKGINFEGLEDSRKSSSFIDEESTYKDIASKGFDHIRLPVDFRHFADENGVLPDSFYKRLDKIIKMANENGLAISLDFHSWWDFNLSNGDDELFYNIWENVATHYKDYDTTMLAFELINEPHTTEGGDLDMDNLNIIQRKAVEIIRSITPDRTIVLATAEWNGSWTLENFTLTDYDNVYVAVHCYSPLEFTHQGMAWMGTQDVHIAMSDFSAEYGTVRSALIRDLRNIPKFEERTGMSVILNEFGLNTGGHISDEDVQNYLSTAVSYLNERDISWSYWAYNGAFGLYEQTPWQSISGKGGSWREVPLNAILPQNVEKVDE